METKFEPTPIQKKAYADVIAAIKKAKKLGLIFYGKSDSLVAYTKQADNYINELDFDKSLVTGFDQIENLNCSILADSGADDYACYRSEEDELLYS